MILWIFALDSFFTLGELEITLETVALETPASNAISDIVTLFFFIAIFDETPRTIYVSLVQPDTLPNSLLS